MQKVIVAHPYCVLVGLACGTCTCSCRQLSHHSFLYTCNIGYRSDSANFLSRSSFWNKDFLSTISTTSKNKITPLKPDLTEKGCTTIGQHSDQSGALPGPWHVTSIDQSECAIWPCAPIRDQYYSTGSVWWLLWLTCNTLGRGNQWC